MAKKTVEEGNVEKNDREELEKIISKKYGSVMFDGSHVKDREIQLIPTTPTLDLSLRGGIPEGSWNLIVGKPKSGKSTLVLNVAANAQKMGKHVYYLDAEHRFSKKNLTTVSHLKTTPDLFTLITSTEEKILSAQDFLNIASDIAANHKGCVLILDSISCLCSENEQAKDVGDMGRHEGGRLFGNFCRKNASIIPINKVLFLGIIHLISNTSGFGASIVEDGGVKIQYQVDGKYVIKGTTSWEEGSGDDKKKIGQIVDFLVAVNPNGPPGDVIKTYLRYNHGYCYTWEIITLGIELGLIVKGGAWFQFQPSVGEPIKVQGQSKLYDWFNQNPTELELLYTNIKAMSL